jgi:hypothetical protein
LTTHTKADRKRKGAANIRYKAEGRHDVNKKRKMAKHAKMVASKKEELSIPRGTARAMRRLPLQREVSHA